MLNDLLKTPKGAHVEIIDDTGHGQDGPLLPRRIRINGTDVGTIAKDSVHLNPGNYVEGEPCSLTLTLYPSIVTIKGEAGEQQANR